VGVLGSITEKMMTHIICFDHIKTATAPLSNKIPMQLKNLYAAVIGIFRRRDLGQLLN